MSEKTSDAERGVFAILTVGCVSFVAGVSITYGMGPTFMAIGAIFLAVGIFGMTIIARFT